MVFPVISTRGKIRFLRTTSIERRSARILVDMKLKKKALEWFHSRSEFISMDFDALIDELRLMFHHRRDKVAVRRAFEARVWGRGER